MPTWSEDPLLSHFQPKEKQDNVCIWLDELPGDQHKGVRFADRSFNHIRQRLLRRALPSLVQGPVRGIGIAQDYLASALLRYSSVRQFALIAKSPKQQSVASIVAARANDASQKTRVLSRSQLMRGGLNTLSPRLWLDITGLMPYSLWIRERHSSRNYPIASVQHGLSIHTLFHDLYLRSLLFRSYPFDVFVCTSHASKSAFATLFSDLRERFNREFRTTLQFNGTVKVIPLCVDTDRFIPQSQHSARKEEGLPPKGIILLYLGNLSILKADLFPLIMVFQKLVRDNPSVLLRLVIAGTGSDAYIGAIRKLTSELGIVNAVVIRPNVTDEEKGRLLSSADIFVSPSDSVQENFGLAPVEALACGVPQIAGDWDGYRETIQHGVTGFLVPTYWAKCDGELEATGEVLGWQYDHFALSQSVAIDLPRLRQYLQLLISDSGLRGKMSRASRIRAEQLFSYQAVARQYDELWTEQAQIAAATPAPRPAEWFDQPAYFRAFRHYASIIINDEDLIRADPEFAMSSWKGLVDCVHSEVHGIRLLDVELLDELTGIVRTSSNSRAKGIEVGAVLSALRGSGYHPDVVRSHLMWLLKYGCFKVSES